MAARAARELKDGYYVNLGIGIPTQVANFIPEGMHVILQSENGMLGISPFPYEGEEDADPYQCGQADDNGIANEQLFLVVRQFCDDPRRPYRYGRSRRHGGISGGDIANWTIPGKMVKGMGGALDLVAGVKRVIVVMEHANKAGHSKVLKTCTLPLTGSACIDMVITDLCVFDVNRAKGNLALREIALGVTLDEIRAKTQADLIREYSREARLYLRRHPYAVRHYGGALAAARPDDLAAHALQALARRNAGLDLSAIDEVVLGCANQAGEDNRNIARMAALLAGFPASVPGVTINRLCASGLDAIGYAARTIASCEAD